jgi:hypothetical protein
VAEQAPSVKITVPDSVLKRAFEWWQQGSVPVVRLERTITTNDRGVYNQDQWFVEGRSAFYFGYPEKEE